MFLFLLLAVAYLEFHVGECKVSFGASPDEQMEADMVGEYRKLAYLESSDDCWDQMGGPENFEELMKYKDQIDKDLTERGYGDLLDEIDEIVSES